MKYWLLVGVSRNQFVSWVEMSLVRLLFFSKHEVTVVVVEGPDVSQTWSKDYIVLKAEQRGVVPFLDAALGLVRNVATPDDWIVRVDEDDYYGENYLDVVDAVRLTGADGTGISSPFVRDEAEQLYFCRQKSEVFQGAFGGTLAASVRTAMRFRSTGKPWGEDSLWVKDMLSQGHRMVPRSTAGFALCRWENGKHTLPIRGEVLPYIWNSDVFALGRFSEIKVSKHFEPTGIPIPPDMSKMDSVFELMQV